MSVKINRKKLKFITGEETGVDRTALDFALSNDISCSGWCPQMREAYNTPRY
ncbi:MAG: hypothetical protein GY744_09965 [Gammaproteobacteria bacterium]|nr:hypothetical protein [Gammaproteobacteria bacterium]